MTIEEMKELLPIIQEWVEGTTLEYYNSDTGEWEVVTKTIFINPNKYRIKHEPKHRPFKNKEECWNEMLKHQPFGWIKSPNGDLSCIDKVFNGGVTHRSSIFSFEDYLDSNYTFADDTPFGVKI